MSTLRSITTLTLAVGLLAGSVLVAEAAATVEAVDWVTVADASPFEGTAVSDVAVAPGGEAVIVGFDARTTSRRAGGRDEGHVWWSPDGSEWRSGTLPGARNTRALRVIATQEGFVATGWRKRRDEAGRGVIWTSRDGTEWSAEAFEERSHFTDLDGVGDTVVVAGEQGETQTVWISRAGGPWQPATVAPAGSRFTASQVALSADGVYLVLDEGTGELYRSEDGTGFSPVDLPDDVLGGADLPAIHAGDVDLEPGRAVGLSLTGVPTGFHLMVQHNGVDGLTAWASSDGLAWRPEAGLPASLWWLGGGDRDAFYSGVSDLAFLQADGAWCTLPSPIAGQPNAYVLGMAWNEDGDILARGWPRRYGNTVLWQASDSRCSP